jgi:hypothetical protein
MRKVISSFGLLIVSTFLLPTIGCSPKALATEWTTPADFDTYTDESNTFSISYPSDWVVDISLHREGKISFEEYSKGIAPHISLENINIVFNAGLPCGIGCYHPSCNIVVGPATGYNSIQEFYVWQKIIMESNVDDYKEFARETTVIDGRESIISESEATTEIGETSIRGHGLVLSTLLDDTVWTVSCGLNPEIADYAEYGDDFQNVVRSLRLH